MCGINGIINNNGRGFDNHHIKKMNSMLIHRGPDSQKTYNFENIYFGHCRLSVIDTSSAADQPFHSSCNRYTMIYNGEVYNFKELAAKYSLKTKTKSDTEVLLQLFIKLGESFIQEINGMFAFAILDKQTKEIYLYRDRLGIKPLYYTQQNSTLIFSSELKSIISIIDRDQKISKDAINCFLHLGYIPQPLSIYESIKKFPAGSYAIFKNGTLNIKKYWEISEKFRPNVLNDSNQALSTLKSLLYSAIEYRLISDVPLGTFLSGGVDSSLVSAIAQDISPNKIKTFSIGFKENSHDESRYAQSIAKILNTDHHQYIMSEQDAVEKVANLNSIYDEPYSDTSAIPSLLVSEMARKQVTVTLSGDGGDELFLGYGMYEWAHRLSNPLLKGFKKPLSFLFRFGSRKYKKASQLLSYGPDNNLQSHIFSQEQYMFSEAEIPALVTFKNKPALFETTPTLTRKLSAREQQAFFDLNYYLKDDLLVKLDRATMHHSLETRVPLLDYRIVEFALNLEENLKSKGKHQKILLKKLLNQFIPSKYIYRPKQGFSIPLAKWLRNDLNFLIDKYLSYSSVKKFNILKPDTVLHYVTRFRNGEDYLYNRVWLLIVLQKWLFENHSNTIN